MSFIGLEKHSYANNLGFSDALHLKGQPFPQGAFGGKNYVPISRMSLASLQHSCEENGTELGDEIERLCKSSAQVVSQGLSQELLKILTYCFREIFRNSFEHGKVGGAVYCAQYWPRLNKVEICIADKGIGIQESLLENSQLPSYDGEEALKVALMPGVSSKAWRHKKKKSSQKSQWDNSGFGLFLRIKLPNVLAAFRSHRATPRLLYHETLSPFLSPRV